jgi:hypothetical protein
MLLEAPGNLVNDLIEEGMRRLSDVRTLAAEHLVEHGRASVDVRALVDALVIARLLRRHVVQSAEGIPAIVGNTDGLQARSFTSPKSRTLQVSWPLLRRTTNIFSGSISRWMTFCACRIESAAGVVHESHSSWRRQGPLLMQHPAQVRAFQVLHDQVRLASPVQPKSKTATT